MSILPDNMNALSIKIEQLNNILRQPQYNNLLSTLQSTNELMNTLIEGISTLSDNSESSILKAIIVLLEENRTETNAVKDILTEMIEQQKLQNQLMSQMLDAITQGQKEPFMKRRERLEATPIKR